MIVAFMPAVIFSAPLNVVGDNAGNGIDSADEEVILSVSTIVNGVKKSEAAAIVEELERLAGDIKSAAFEAFMMEVTQKAMTVAEVKQAVEAVKVRMSPVGFCFRSRPLCQYLVHPCRILQAFNKYLSQP